MLVKDLQRIPVPKTFTGITPQLCGDFLTHSRKRLPHIPHLAPGHSQRFEASVKGPEHFSASDLFNHICSQT